MESHLSEEEDFARRDRVFAQMKRNLNAMPQEHYRFADLAWQSRWNSPTAPCVSLDQVGSRLMATGIMGVLYLDLDNDEDVRAVVTKLKRYTKAIEEAKRRYDTVMEAIGEDDVR